MELAHLNERDKVVFHEVVAPVGGHHSHKPGGFIMTVVCDSETERATEINNLQRCSGWGILMLLASDYHTLNSVLLVAHIRLQ